MSTIAIKRAYESPSERDGTRVLVDRVWPRGRSKAQLKVKTWLKEVAPSTALRKWFGHDPERWPEFKRRYRHELASPAQRKRLHDLLRLAGSHKLTLVYGAKDEEHNQAVVLCAALQRMR